MALPEEAVIAGFHSLLQDSLSQIRGEGLLTDEELEAAEPSVQIAAPALVLFFAALGAVGEPPTISSPDRSFVLSTTNCPASFSNAFRLWTTCVGPIKRLDDAARHDLALILCDKEIESSVLRLDVSRLASDLKGIALEILQRRTFQLRLQSDLNAALDSSVRPRSSGDSDRPSRASFEPPPMYSEGRPTEETKRAYARFSSNDLADGSGRRGRSSMEETGAVRIVEQEENLNVIRETLYSAFADAIVETPAILEQLSRGTDWAPRAFFASTCLAILEVALSRVDTHGVRVVDMGRRAPKVIGIAETPPYLRPFLGKLVELSQAVQALAAQDDERAIEQATSGTIPTSAPRIEQLRARLAGGVGSQRGLEPDDREGEQQLSSLANAINEMALGMSSLPAFRERQTEAFKVLVSITAL
ncbi:hypothetical protein JCM10212_005042 [Sporobolomyces blumeae]